MRTISILFTALAFTFSVSAASYNKRAINSGIQSCISSLTDANEQLLILKTIARNQYVSFQAFNLNEPRLESSLGNARDECCAASAISDEEVNGVINMFATTTSKITDLFDVFILKNSPQFPAASATARVKDFIRSLAGIVISIDDCIVSATPDSRHSDVQSYITVVNDKVTTTFKTYGMEA